MYKESTDRYALLAPPKALKLNWKQPCDPEWMLKMSSLCFDFAELAPNSKLKGSKLRETISLLLEKGDVTNSTNKDKRSFVDSCDLMIRIAMQQFRHAISDLGKRDQLFKRLPKAHSARIKLVLDSIWLPRDFQESSDEEGDVSLQFLMFLLFLPILLALQSLIPRSTTLRPSNKCSMKQCRAPRRDLPKPRLDSAQVILMLRAQAFRQAQLLSKLPQHPCQTRTLGCQTSLQTSLRSSGHLQLRFPLRPRRRPRRSPARSTMSLSFQRLWVLRLLLRAKIMKKPSASASPRAPTMKRPASAGPSQPVED